MSGKKGQYKMASGIRYRLADVFAEDAYEGNGVSVFIDPPEVNTDALQRVAAEVRQFESIFLWGTNDPLAFRTRIFLVDGELGFAGHPVLGAAAVLHDHHLTGSTPCPTSDEQLCRTLTWRLRLGPRDVQVASVARGHGRYSATMDQGAPQFGRGLERDQRARVAAALNLNVRDLCPDLPIEWASTGLRYLIVPVTPRGLAGARIASSNFAKLLAEFGAELAYVFCPATREGRNWANDGSVEDIATGSAAGPAAAYLVRHDQAGVDETVGIHQGRFLGRPSLMKVDVTGGAQQIERVTLTGDVCLTGSGVLDHVPRSRA